MAAYDAAWAIWEQKKAEIDQTTPRKHQRDYEAAIDGWESVLAWSNHHGDREFAELATRKLGSLRKRFALLVLPPLDRLDRLGGMPGAVPYHQTLNGWPRSASRWRKMPVDPRGGESSRSSAIQKREHRRRPRLSRSWSRSINCSQRFQAAVKHRANDLCSSHQTIGTALDASRQRSGRIGSRFRSGKPRRKTRGLKAHIEKYVGRKEKHGNAGQISVGRVRSTKIHLAVFQDWAGKDLDVAKIDEEVLEGFHEHLLEKVASKTWSGTTASDCMSSVKSLVRSLWVKKAIANLPRTLDPKCKDLLISKSNSKIEVFTTEEVKAWLAEATKRDSALHPVDAQLRHDAEGHWGSTGVRGRLECWPSHSEEVQDIRPRERAGR